MDKNLRKNLESIFRDSNNIDALFDAFQLLIFYKIKDKNLFETLLANPVLSADEVSLFADKLAKEFKTCSYHIYFWTAEIFETRFLCQEYSFNYFSKAAQLKPFSHEPFVSMLRVYNYDYQTTTNIHIIEFIENRVEFVEKKSKVYSALANHYIKIGDDLLMSMYKSLAEACQKEEAADEDD